MMMAFRLNWRSSVPTWRGFWGRRRGGCQDDLRRAVALMLGNLSPSTTRPWYWLRGHRRGWESKSAATARDGWRCSRGMAVGGAKGRHARKRVSLTIRHGPQRPPMPSRRLPSQLPRKQAGSIEPLWGRGYQERAASGSAPEAGGRSAVRGRVPPWTLPEADSEAGHATWPMRHGLCPLTPLGTILDAVSGCVPAMSLRRTGASFTRPVIKRQRRRFVLCR